jgi:hypothetical protein
MERNNGIIYSSAREGLMNQLSRCQRLQQEGISTGSLQEETFNKLIELAEMDDKERLGQLRKELTEL